MEESSQGRPKKWTRFGIRSVLLFAMLVALLLAAFQYGRIVGVEEGFRDGFAEGLTAKVYPVTYRVSDLVAPRIGSRAADYQGLIDEIVTTVQPKSWDDAGGPATLAAYPSNQALVVSQTPQGHDDLAEFLEAKRDSMGRASVVSTTIATRAGGDQR